MYLFFFEKKEHPMKINIISKINKININYLTLNVYNGGSYKV
jgi:hypothetical protein